jgi:phosphate starvation-inducible protein PhoH
MDNLERAQQGYEIVVLQKDPGASKGDVSAETEKHMYEVLTDVIVKHNDEIVERADVAVENSAVKVERRLEAAAKEAVRAAAESRAPILVRTPDKKVKTVKGILQPEFKRLVELASARIPIMMVGPAGCGKTYLAGKIAEALGSSSAMCRAAKACRRACSTASCCLLVRPARSSTCHHRS